MKKLIEVDITGTLQVPFELSTYFDLENYLYYKKKHQTIEAVTTIKFDDTTAYFPRNLDKFIKSIKEPDKFKIKFHNKTVTNPVNISVSDTFSLLDRQKEPTRQMLELLRTKSQCILQAPPSWGKEQPLYSKILTPNGWTTMGKIKVGDYVIGSDGLPKKVLEVFPQGVKDVYRLHFSDKTYVDCGLEHLWTVNTGDYSLTLSTKSLIILVKDYTYFIPKFKDYPIKSITKIEKLSSKTEMKCIAIDSQDHLYVTDGYTLTHNSYSLAHIVKELGQKSLILVDKTLLADQMYKEFKNNTKDTDISLLSSKNKKLGDVNIATLQFLLRNNDLLEQLNKEIGFVVQDECHAISIGAFTDVIHSIPARYRLGLSATPTRSDGLTEAIYDALGYHKVIATNPDNLDVDIYLHHIPISAYGEDYHTFLFNLYTHRDFLKRLVKLVTAAVKNKRQVLLYTTSQSIQVFYQELFKHFKPLLLNSNSTQKKKNEILEKFDKRESPILISGTSVTKGVSIYTLDTIINCAFNTKENLEQLIGRLRRNDDTKKKPVFITFSFDSAYKQGQKQEKILRNLVKPTNDTFNKVGKFGDLVDVLEA